VAPSVIYRSHTLTDADWPEVARAYQRRIDGLFTDRPIQFRTQNGGHYDGRQVLKPGLGAGETGTRIHLLQPGDPEEGSGRPATRNHKTGRTMTDESEVIASRSDIPSA
jgi:NAD(P)H dehydrogenase (quinone)